MDFFRGIKKFFIPSEHNAFRPHSLRRRSLLVLLSVLLITEGVFVANLIVRESGNSFLAAIIKSEIVSLTNTERQQNRVLTLKENALLTKSAQAKANDMAAKSYFSHTSPGGRLPWTWIEFAGYDYQAAGENLAVRFIDSKDVVVAWMASPSHRANLIKASYTDIGVGVAQGIYKGTPATFVVQHFARPSPNQLAQQSLGAAVGDVAAVDISNAIIRTGSKVLTEPYQTTTAMVGGVLTLLMIALGLALFRHMQIQAHDLLVPGMVVAGIALAILVINGQMFILRNVPSQEASIQGYTGVQLPADEAAAFER
jgi:hypothetical protein